MQGGSCHWDILWNQTENSRFFKYTQLDEKNKKVTTIISDQNNITWLHQAKTGKYECGKTVPMYKTSEMARFN